MEAQVPSCPKCNEFLNQTDRLPLLLPCGETYCKNCITRSLENNKFMCNSGFC